MDESEFQLERSRLIGVISENLGKLITATNVLNRNIEASVAVGSQFDAVSELWTKFEGSLKGAPDAGQRASADTSMMPIGVAPGGGSLASSQNAG